MKIKIVKGSIAEVEQTVHDLLCEGWKLRGDTRPLVTEEVSGNERYDNDTTKRKFYHQFFQVMSYDGEPTDLKCCNCNHYKPDATERGKYILCDVCEETLHYGRLSL
jgi:hypothetical protein